MDCAVRKGMAAAARQIEESVVVGGYNKKTGIFSLTQSKAGVWCRKPSPDRLGLIEHCARLLRDAGHAVLLVRSNFLEVKATPGQVWEALSGQPSDPKREALHI
jgi:hypothetical protein